MNPNDLPQVTETASLTNCDREPIHLPGSIQAHGVLFVLSEPDLRILQVSQNTQEIMALAPRDLLNRPLTDFIQSDSLQEIGSSLHDNLDDNLEALNPLPLTIRGTDDTLRPFNGIVHRAPGGELVWELEPRDPAQRHNFFNCHRLVKETLSQVQTASNLRALCQLITEKIRQITGFDRVMVYRFDKQGSGRVIAEAKQPNLESFLDLCYPDSDVPQQAKLLYLRNWLRLIPDINYTPQSLLWAAPTPPPPLDMSDCVLRSVSPLHVEYLQNMGVTASMSISLIQHQKLWGLIVCHHYRPKFVPYETRLVCELLGQLMSTEIATKEATENLDYQLQIKKIQGRFVESLAGATDFMAELTAQPEMLLKLTSAQGVAVCEGTACQLIGQTPNQDQVNHLLAWLDDRFERDLFVTDALPRLYPPAQNYRQVASGVLAIAISQIQSRYVLWFRPELAKTVTWAGKPDKPKQHEADGSLTLNPRKSFEAWQEIVRGQSDPWLSCEVTGAVELRQGIVGIVLRQADQLAKINTDLQRSNSELDAFTYIASHDLKEPLRGIHNYATFLIEDYTTLLPPEGQDKLHTLVRLTKRMEDQIETLLKFSRLGRQELQMQAVDLNQLLAETIEIFKMNPQWQEFEIRIQQPLPPVWGDYVLIAEIFTNLIANALKYNTKAQKYIEIGCYESSQDKITLYVRDNGIGIRDKHRDVIFRIFKRLHSAGKYGGGTGAGLTIVQKIVKRHHGNIRVESSYGEGTTFIFTLPGSSPASDDG